MKSVLAMPDVREKLASQGAEALGSTPEEFAERIKSDMAKWSKVVKVSGARPD